MLAASFEDDSVLSEVSDSDDDEEEGMEESVGSAKVVSSVLFILLLGRRLLVDSDSDSDSELELEDSEDVSSRFRFWDVVAGVGIIWGTVLGFSAVLEVFVALRVPATSFSSSASLSEEEEEEELDEGALLRLCLSFGVLVVAASSSESDFEDSELLVRWLVPDEEDADALLVELSASLSSAPLLLSLLSVSELELCWASFPLSFCHISTSPSKSVPLKSTAVSAVGFFDLNSLLKALVVELKPCCSRYDLISWRAATDGSVLAIVMRGVFCVVPISFLQSPLHR